MTAAAQMREIDVVAEFRNAMAGRGIISPVHIIADGKIHRCDTAARNGKGDAAYLLHLDGAVPAGGFENHQDGLGWENWRADIGLELSTAERVELRDKAEADRQQREADLARRHAEAAQNAEKIWNEAVPCTEHSYLVRKGLAAGYGARVSKQGDLVLPLRDAGGKLRSLQFIKPDGGKTYLEGGQVSGCYNAIGKPGGIMLIGEGFATCASAHEATGYPVAIAFDCGKLRSVAHALRTKFPHAQIVMLADDDHLTIGNPGISKAREAAMGVGGFVAVPKFGADRPERAKDFNDMMQIAGAAAVKIAIDSATEPKRTNQASEESNSPSVRDFSEMAEEAFIGLAGDLVRLIEPHTESDLAGLLLSAHTFFGNCIGRGPHYRVESTEHGVNLFVLKIGDSAKARKGTGEDRVRSFFRHIDEKWTTRRLHTGLSSGEGVIWEVRDPITKLVKDGKRANAAMVEETVDAGVSDKRLLIIESEFAGALRAMQQEGNVLSRVLRDAWDRGDLATLTKNSPARATGASISIVGHITAAELRECLDKTEMANGFGNRFLFACVRRSKFLPFGGNLPEPEVAAMAARIGQAVERARAIRGVVMSPQAADAWMKIYPDLSADRPGLLGSLTARAEAQVVRLATLYALWARADRIALDHLIAAAAVQEFCAASVEYVFGDTLGDQVADTILAALKTAGLAGLTRTEINNLFSRNVPANQIARALGELSRRGLAFQRKGEAPNGGRPPEIWALAEGRRR
jgi:phage/plasmid primase-like uncharacterized protein